MYLRIIIIFLSIFATILRVHAEGETFTDGIFKFRTTSEGECEIIYCDITSGPLKIPETANFNGTTLNVTGIYAQAFGNAYGNHKFTGDLIIPNGIKYIGYSAFYNNTGFTSLTLGKSLTQIGPNAFYECTGLKTINFNDNDVLKTIGSDAFHNCSGFTGDLILPNSVEFIDQYAFAYTGFNGKLKLSDSLKIIKKYTFEHCHFTDSLILPQSLESIEEFAFNNCKGFVGDLIIPNSVTSIGWCAFWGCSGFNGSLILSDSLMSLWSDAFSDCSGFTGNLKIPESLKTIQPYTFQNCSGFTGQLQLPPSIKHIGKAAFQGCSGLTGDLVLDSIRTIANSAFEGCAGLKGTIKLNKLLNSIGRNAFYGCSGINGLIIEDGDKPLSLQFCINPKNAKDTTSAFADCPLETLYIGRPLSYESKFLPFNNQSKLINVTIAASISNLDNNFFDGCTKIENLIIQDSWEPITLGSNGDGKGLFAHCMIDSMYLGRTVSAQSHPAQFQNMTTITKLDFGSTIRNIGESTFSGCTGIKSLTLPASLNNIEDNAFARCTSIKNLVIQDAISTSSGTLKPVTVSFGTIDGNRGAFADSPLESIYLGKNLDYQISPFKGKSSIIKVSVGKYVGKINDECFAGCSGLETLSLQGWYDTLYGSKFDRIIGKKAFADCSALSDSLIFPPTVTAIEDEAFVGCVNTPGIIIAGEKNSALLPVGVDAFRGVKAKKVTLNRNTTGSPFAGNASLNDLTIGEMVT
ncbi:MAG: leucine-rich repeat domain-containing protein, partial [Paramuribaculum sp.]|nr:leucine-rich repeat domain-containing protein [Paramuribaculum sp.]